METYAGVDLGATKLWTVAGTTDGDVVGRDRRPTPQGPDGDVVAGAVVDSLEAACAGAGLDPTDLAAVGVGSIGPLDVPAGAVVSPPNLDGDPERIDLVPAVADRVGHDRVYLRNDAIAGLVGERCFGGRGAGDLVYLTISSGIGAGVAVDGHVLGGHLGNAAEVGHFTLAPGTTFRCGCGGTGHWEAFCSGANIPRYARHLHREPDAWPAGADPATGTPTDLPLDDPGFSARDVFAAEGGDAFATAVIEQVARWNALGVATLVHAYAPATVAVGGAVALGNQEAVLAPVRERLPELVIAGVPTVEATSLGDEVVVKGALAVAMTGGSGDPADMS